MLVVDIGFANKIIISVTLAPFQYLLNLVKLTLILQIITIKYFRIIQTKSDFYLLRFQKSYLLKT